jgi:hypothetical protein
MNSIIILTDINGDIRGVNFDNVTTFYPNIIEEEKYVKINCTRINYRGGYVEVKESVDEIMSKLYGVNIYGIKPITRLGEWAEEHID